MMNRSASVLRRRGASLLEILIAVAIAVLIVTVVSAVFVQVIRESSVTRAEVRATTGARLAADQVARELRGLQLDAETSYQTLIVRNNTLLYGDWIDNDNDGAVDEEEFDGRDTDGDWTPDSDRHAETALGFERPDFVGVPDYGDANVDEDVRFSHDELIFIIPPVGLEPRRRVHYRVGTFDGVPNVLLKGVVLDPAATEPFGDEIIEPVLFDVLSFDVLAWNPNDDADGPVADVPYWATEWDSAEKVSPLKPLNSPDGTPPFQVPAAFLISVVTNAERVPLSELPPLDAGLPIKTARVTTIISVESVINSSTYNTYLREP